MRVGFRSYVAMGVALLAASVIAVTPVAPPPPLEIHVANPAVRLAADASVFNIPINLIQDFINIPYNEVQAINTLGESLLFGGTWWGGESLFGYRSQRPTVLLRLGRSISVPRVFQRFGRAGRGVVGGPFTDQFRLQRQSLPEPCHTAFRMVPASPDLGAVDDRQIHV